ncbi:hypothetical protein [Neisseria yangbaofengii]|uniref:hypothetical protein n=1 Tax=Neisseria yangbaofengii TaxID=2709396 RepID=UPI0021066B0B
MAITLIPEAVAFSIVAGVDPQIGLYASFCIAVAVQLCRLLSGDDFGCHRHDGLGVGRFSEGTRFAVYAGRNLTHRHDSNHCRPAST